MIRRTKRRARVTWRCDGCSGWIHPGNDYLEVVASPDHGDLCNPAWWKLRECEDCSIRRGVWEG